MFLEVIGKNGLGFQKILSNLPTEPPLRSNWIIKLNFLIAYTVTAYFYIPFNITCSYVLLATAPFMYFINLYLYCFCLPLLAFSVE